MLKSFLCALLFITSLAPPAHAGEAGFKVQFSDTYGPMAPRYMRLLSPREGGIPSDDELTRWKQRLLTLRNLKGVSFQRLSDRIQVHLTEAPHTFVIPRYLPVIAPVGLELGADDWRLGGQYYDFRAWAGYVWNGVTLYDPNRTDSVQHGRLTYQFPEAFARVGLLVLPFTKIYLEGRAAGAAMEGNLPLAAEYGSTHGTLVTAAPFLRYDDTDHPDIPRMGTRARAGVLLGPAWLGNSGSYARYDGYLQHYLPLGETDSLALGVHGGVGDGDLPLAQTYWLGGGGLLRGYALNRFVGNQMLSLSLELRHALLPNVGGSSFTVWSTGFIDVARSWNRGSAIAFPQDMRPALGGYLGFSLGNWYIGRIEAAIGNEGPFVSAGAGLPFPW